MSYKAEYQRSMDDPQGFWREKAEALKWFKFPQTILSQDEHGIYRWFKDGEMNTAYMALDHHVEEGRGDQLALIYDSPVSNTKTRVTYRELRDQVARTAGMLRELGVEKGDRVIIYMPMMVEAVVAMLACARLGAVHSVVFGGFAPPELAVRLEDAQPKVILSASCGIEISRIIEYKPLLDKAIELSAHKPDAVVIWQRPQATASLSGKRDHDWAELMARAEPADPVPVKGTDPLYILYTSGTTGKPKGVVRENGGHAVAMNYSMQEYANDIVFAAAQACEEAEIPPPDIVTESGRAMVAHQSIETVHRARHTDRMRGLGGDAGKALGAQSVRLQRSGRATGGVQSNRVGLSGKLDQGEQIPTQAGHHGLAKTE